MSVVTLQQLKADLRITSTAQDDYLQDLLDAVSCEMLSFLNMEAFPSPVPPSLITATWILARARHSVEDAREIERHRKLAETIMYPHRVEIGF